MHIVQYVWDIPYLPQVQRWTFFWNVGERGKLVESENLVNRNYRNSSECKDLSVFGWMNHFQRSWVESSA